MPRRRAFVAALLAAVPLAAQQTTTRDLLADTWVATDALGRAMPTSAEVGPPKAGRRVVGIFYITWHQEHLGNGDGTYGADVTRILAADPKARLDAKHPLWTYPSYHWAEPECGYFLSHDEYVIRKDMLMLTAAGVDVLVMDVTNAVRYWAEWEAVFSVMQEMQQEGTPVPRFCFWAFNGPVITVVQDLYDRIYAQGRYRELWFEWDQKPLLLCNLTPSVDANGGGFVNPNPHFDAAAAADAQHPHHGDPDFCEPNYRDYSRAVKQFFTRRSMWWGYYEWAGKRFVGTEHNWSFGLDLGDARVAALRPEQLVSTTGGRREQAAVTPAQHASSGIGRSWTRERGEPELDEHDLPVPTLVPWLGKVVERPEAHGIYFQQRFDEAIAGDPEFLYLNDWNEWTAGKYQPEQGTFPFLRRQSGFFFVDQYDAEFSRSIQPMKGGFTDNYYMQMVANIRRYKGVREVPVLRGEATIRIDGVFDDWRPVAVEYRDAAGDTCHRDCKGYGGVRYVDDSGRNDIVTCKVAVAGDDVAFLAEARQALTPPDGRHWMLLFLDADHDAATGWCGADFVVNLQVLDEDTTTLRRFVGGEGPAAWAEVAKVPYRRAGNALELAVPKAQLGLGGDAFTFDFQWADNPSELRDAISLCTSGDAAPDRRFRYRCVWRR